ncbi:hypothetical protein AQUCO_07200071v1 [Aquilegia coerulea]|uniref:Nicalin n=1 Tax=Aquilegia coerulea TaxID=218851 RepID=A0A2G5CA71_AQUCA|nr:hypothetical protein AQUCO_07200071v1 [Aquilegia coerulea]
MAMTKGRQREMLESVYSCIAVFFIFVACVELCDAATVVDVYRLIQYDISGVPFGSRLARLNHHVAYSPFIPGADLSRAVVIIPIREVNITFLRECITQKKALGGLLLLLPQKFNSESKDDSKEGGQMYKKEGMQNILTELEKLLINAAIPYPVYFAFEDEKIDAILAEVKKKDAIGQSPTATTGGYKAVTANPEPRKLAPATITNIQGWLPGLRTDGDANQLPTIAIVASYDTFGAAPALSVGSDSNGSGVVALLEIARLFSRLYSNPKTRGRYNILFGLTSGGPYNYNGTMKWLRSLDQRVRESIDYAICLNSIGSWNNELWVHVSKPPENAYIKQVFEVAWEHEQFSRVRVTALTLSELSAAPGLLESTGSLFDSRQFVNDTAVRRSVKLVAESLGRHIYAHPGKNIEIFADGSSLAINPFYIKSWLNFLSQTPRVAPFLSKNEQFISALKKELADHTVEVNVQQDVLDGIFTFYDSTTARLTIYQVVSVAFDLLLLLAVGSYLIMLFSGLVITTRGVDDLIGIFRRPPSRKQKIA